MVKINKKAMEMSLNLIIMLIIGMVVLGLVIGFVTNLVKKGESQFDSKLSEVEDQQKKEVEAQSGIFAAGPASFKVKSGGESTKVFYKIYNPTDTAIAITGAGTIISVTLTDIDAGASTTSGGCQVSMVVAPLDVAPKDTQVGSVSVLASKQCDPSKTFFITIKFTPGGDVVKSATLSGEISE